MPIARPKMVLIDLDGTLVDSVPDLAFCVDAMMRELGLPERGEAAVRQWVGNGVERLVQRALINAVDGEPEPSEFQRALPVFMRLYKDNTSGRSCLYPGVREGLDYLKRAGLRLACVTNKAEQFTLPLLRDMGILDDFELVVSGDTLPVKKPDPAPLLYAASKLGVTPGESLMVGDSRSDVKAARAAGFPIVCVSYGYNHGEDIRNYSPDAVIDRLDQIQGLLEDAA
ncbi:phosphoglycolate phosphatase [Thioalkalivibrio sulfidiphilus]|uniref:phosphoglycolate phosphatase n=1 Tax=Thioalkalivibrio sulfidiphilus TaxID=1033854 RepID=UPI00047754ED|nr:phosphoglycolate phosphatase [Thioalkalivibrio sulfidiphilus]